MSSARFRHATTADSLTIAALHIVSWRSAYRGILPDAYLDHEIVAEREQLWATRMAAPQPERRFVLLAEQEQQPIGFVCVLLDEEPAWGACLDNLHMRPDQIGQGVGRQLFAYAAKWVQQTQPQWPLHLWVFAANQQAIRFYQRYGGQAIESAQKLMPDGTTHELVRYVWHDLGLLKEAITIP